MNRVATIPMQRNLSTAIQKSQQQLAETQLQLASGKKARDYAALGTQTVRQISARSLLSRQEAQSTVANTVGTTLSLYDANITAIDSSVSDLQKSILTAVGTGQSVGLQEAIEQTFQQFRASLNASEGGLPLFAGSQTDSLPFKPAKLADTVGMAASDAFSNDGVRASAHVADGVDVEYGAGADEVGTKLFLAFQKLAAAGDIGEKPTDAQNTALNEALSMLGDGLVNVRNINAENGRKQQQIETLGTRADDRAVLLKDLIKKNEDADLAQVAIDLNIQQTTLKASFSVFSQLSTLSLTDYLR
ncbi:flagellin [Sphingosinicella sp. BN140058]|uniref:flagellin n=1 Tax=Sphingosinicella sp. BN140058 TaxID=1892855 RepID=UPI0010116F69|nr:flagellin [Sphingosinicella sp. BN140058]QAY77290.1 flagellin [Sphingosinicella sp. BN140058]